MVEPAHNPSRLYRRTLGEAFDSLPPILKRFHEIPSEAVAQGSFRITRGSGLLRQALATAMRLPSPGEQVPARIKIQTDGEEERWTREFGSLRMVTRQWLDRGLLVETAGPMRIGFRVSADATGMRFEFAKCWLMRLPLPNALAPRVNGVVSVRETGWWVQIRIELPLLGMITQYEGEVTPTCRLPSSQG